MIASIKQGDLLAEICLGDTGIDAIMNAANAVGPMGRGIAGAIRRAGGDEIQAAAFATCKTNQVTVGGAYRTISGTLKQYGVEYVIHAVTMKNPGGTTTLPIIKDAFLSATHLALSNGLKKMGCTALGTGVGGLDPVEVARRMFPVADEAPMDIVFMDFSAPFINELNRFNK